MKIAHVFTLAILISIFSVAMTYADPPIPTNYPICALNGLQNEEQIFVCPTDSNIVLADWRDFRLGYRQVGIGRSTDAGDTWTHKLIPYGLLLYDRQSDPTMAVDNNGNYYICVLDYSSTSPESYVTFIKSADLGVTWTGPYPVEHGFIDYFEDKQFITVDRTHGTYEGNIYVSWTRFDNPTRIIFARSTDGAVTFDDTLIVGPINDFSACGGPSAWDAGQFSFPTVGSDGAVYVFWPTWFLEPPECVYNRIIQMVKSTDGGVTFTGPEAIRILSSGLGTIDGGVEIYDNPVCAVDITGGPFDGNIYIATALADVTNTEFNDWNIEIIKSSDGGDTWTEPYYINDDYTGPGATYDQFHPWLICNDEGTLVIIWYDQRTDPVNHYNFDLFAAYSFDGGESFTTNHRISEVSIDPDYLGYTSRNREDQYRILDPRKDQDQQSRAGKIAEYIGVTAFKDHVNAIWTDTRNFNQDAYGANWVIPLLRPRLLAPANGERALEIPTFNWATSWKQDDDQYLVEVATDDQFSNIIISETTTESEFTAASPLSDGTYYWRVRAEKISNAETSEYSLTFAFTVDTYIPIKPALLSPYDDKILTVDNPEFVWELAETPSSDVFYTLQVSPDETFTDGTLLRSYYNLTETSCTPSDLIYTDTVYYWTVQAKNWADQSLGFADAFSFELIYYTCGDLDDDTNINILDIVFLINYIYKNGPAPEPLISADVNHDGNINILDIVLLINYIYKNGVQPVCDI